MNGGAPVRTTILNTSCPGSQFYDHYEQDQTDEAIATHGLFRWYGPEGQAPAREVATLEKEFAVLLFSMCMRWRRGRWRFTRPWQGWASARVMKSFSPPGHGTPVTTLS